MAPADNAKDPHVPVLIDPLIRAVAPVRGIWVDGTFGAGGYTRRLLDAGADRVIGIDRDPSVFDMAQAWAGAAAAACSAGGIGALVHRRDRRDRDGAAAHDPRLLWVSRRAVRL